jgi:hypothetical protein
VFHKKLQQKYGNLFHKKHLCCLFGSAFIEGWLKDQCGTALFHYYRTKFDSFKSIFFNGVKCLMWMGGGLRADEEWLRVLLLWQ